MTKRKTYVPELVSFESLSTQTPEPENYSDPEQALQRKIRLEFLEAALGQLSPLERRIIELRYMTQPHYTRQQVADDLNVAKSYAHYYEDRALRILHRIAANDKTLDETCGTRGNMYGGLYHILHPSRRWPVPANPEMTD